MFFQVFVSKVFGQLVMVKFVVVALLALAAFVAASNAVKLDCEFQTLHGWNVVSSVDGAGSVYGGIIKT